MERSSEEMQDLLDDRPLMDVNLGIYAYANRRPTCSSWAGSQASQRLSWLFLGFPAGLVLADVLRQTGGAYQTTTPMSGKFRLCIRAVAMLTSDDELLRIADLPEVPVSLENCRQLDPQTRIVLVCRLDVSPAESPRWRRIQLTGISLWPRGEPRILDMCEGARIEERVLLPDSFSLLRMGPAADLPA
jgi:hypothetical protein